MSSRPWSRRAARRSPSISCYAHKEDTRRSVDIFNRTVESVADRCRLSTYLCFGNYRGRPVGKCTYHPLFPDFLEFNVDELSLEMANREFAEVELLGEIAESKDVAVGIVDVKNYYIKTPEDLGL